MQFLQLHSQTVYYEEFAEIYFELLNSRENLFYCDRKENLKITHDGSFRNGAEALNGILCARGGYLSVCHGI